MKLKRVSLFCVVLLILAAMCLWAKNPRQDFNEGLAALADKATQARGEALLDYVIAFRPGTPEASEAAFNMAEHFKGNRPKELRYYEIAMRTPGPHSEAAERSYGYILSATGDKQKSAEIFLARANRGKDRDESLTAYYMNCIGLSRTDKPNREAWRAKAKAGMALVMKNKKSPFYTQAVRNLYGLEMEEAQNGKRTWDSVIKSLDAASDDPTCALMAAEACQFAHRPSETVLYYTDKARQHPEDRVPYFRATYVAASAYLETDPAQAGELYNEIVTNMLPADEYAGMSTVEYSLYWWSTIATGQTKEAILEQLRTRYPNSEFVVGGK